MNSGETFINEQERLRRERGEIKDETPEEREMRELIERENLVHAGEASEKENQKEIFGRIKEKREKEEEEIRKKKDVGEKENRHRDKAA